MSKIDDKTPHEGNGSDNKDTNEGAVEKGSMFDSIKQYFKGMTAENVPATAEEIPATEAQAAEKAVGDNGQLPHGDEAGATAKALQGAPNNDGEPIDAAQKPDEEDKPKELTLEDIEKLEAAAAGEADGSGFSVPATIQQGDKGIVTSLERDLGLGPFPPAEQKVWENPPEIQSTQIDNPVEILDLTPKLEGGDAIVYEDDLLANRGPNESAGSDTTKESTTVPGDFKIVALDGVNNLTVGGQFVIQNGVFAPIDIVTPLGNILSITGYDPNTGVVTYQYTLLDNEQHPQGDGNNSIFEDFDVHLSDTDGDTADGILSINIIDDVPSIEVSEELASLIVDESFLAVDATGSFAGLFNAVPGADGASIVYVLNISQEGADSGIVDTFTNSPVLLFKDGDDVVGRVGDLEVFRISIDPNNGDVTLDQSRAVVHPDPNDHNDVVSLGDNSLITLTATITDGDGDVASATRDIANAFHFRDDAPSIDVSLADKAPDKLIVDETNLNINATADFSDNFIVNPNFGADGPGNIVTDYHLQIPADGTDSGLIDVATQESVLLYLNNGVVEGRTSGTNDLVFTVSVDGNGLVTLDQIRALDHPNPNNPDDAVTLANSNLVQLVREDTITDKDGDSATDDAVLNIGKSLIFKDDGPQIDIGLSGQAAHLLQVDETNLAINATENFADNFTIISSSYGADGPGSITNNYALSISADGANSGLIDVATGQSVLLHMNGNMVEGRTSGSNAVVFTVSVDNHGNVTLDQIRALQHPDPNNHDDAITLSDPNLVKLTLTATIIDKDGDPAQDSQSLNIGQALSFKDDGPSIHVSLVDVAPDALVVDETNLNINASANFADNFNVTSNYGADGAGTITSQYELSIAAPGADSGLIDVATGQHVLLSVNGGVVEGRTAIGNDLVFTVTVDGVGIVTLDQIRALQHPNPSNPNDAVSLSDANLIKLTRTDTIVDKDGDHADSSATLNIGQALSFKDDGPSIHVTLATVPVDELVVDETNLNINASANFADNFIVTSNYGADGAGSITTNYSLSVSSPNADSGLIDVLTGQHVLLTLNDDGVVEGRTTLSNALVFTVSVDDAGIVTLDQIRAISHPDPNNPDDAVKLSAAELIKLTLHETIIDKDGDQANSAATLNIGLALTFKDDGPQIDVNETAAPVLVVDESNFLINDSTSFAGLFTASFGADGPKDVNHDGVADADAITYSLNVSAPGADSGLHDTVTGQSVLLTLEDGVVVGRAGLGGPIVLTISVDANTGVITLDQSRSVVHPNTNDPNDSTMFSDANLVKLTATAHDGDLDTASATKDIGQSFKFQDDGPIAVNDCFDVPLPVQPKYNLTFVLDVSGSMGTVLPGTGKTRIQLLKESLTSDGALLDSYQEASSDLVITIVTFNNSAQTSMEFHSVEDAKAYINGLSANGTTNYQAAAAAATADIVSDSNNAALNDHIDRLYWLSDGAPMPASTALSDAQELAWRNLVNANNIEVYMLNIGSTNINEINNNLRDLDDDQPGTVITVEPDLSNLQQLLIDTINQSEVQGNVLANDIAGADQNPEVVNVYFFLADNAAANAYLAEHSDLIGATVDGNKVTIPIPNANITTPLGNILHIEADGDFTYTTMSHDDQNQGDHDNMFYTMRDGDGDRASAELCFLVDLGVMITNLTPKAQGGDVVVDEDDLLSDRGQNESAGSDNTKESTTQPGDFNISAPNGVGDLSIGGHAVITNGVFAAVSFTTPEGNTLSITGYNPTTGLITYTYTLNDNEQHPNANGENSLFEDFQVTLTDIDGDSASAILSARIIDDVPDAINDTNASIASESNLVLTGNVRTNDIQGADGANVTPVSLNGTYGSIVINADGSYVYTLNVNDADFKALGGGGIGNENFTYTLTDGDGDFDTAKLTLNIKNNDDSVLITDLTPKAQGGDVTVDEDDLLANRGPNESEGSDLSKESTTQAGNFKISAPDGVDSLTIGGNAVITGGAFSPISFSTPLGNTLSITGYNSATGVVSYEYTLRDNENHPTGNGENSIFEDFAVVLKDVDGDTANDTLSARIIDDVPTAVNDSFTVPIPDQPKYNLTFVLDVSGSMGTMLPGTGKTRIQLLKEALTGNGALLDSYQAASNDLVFTIITFSNNAQTSIEFHSVDAAKSYINALNANGTTNYQAAAAAATADVNADDANPALNGYIDRMYWISDGEPNPGNTALNDAQELAWRNNLIEGNVEAYMLNIGGTNNNINEHLADLDDDQPGTVITVAPDLSNLQQLLVDTINETEVQGNVLTNDIKGADGNPSVINVYFNFDNAQEANSYKNDHPELTGISVNGNTVIIPIPNGNIVTPLGNVLHIGSDGNFTYVSNVNNSINGGKDTLYYTMQDNDGDTSSAELSFNIDAGVTITNLTSKAQGGDVSVNEDDLLASRGLNESAGSDPSKESTTQAGDFKISAPDGIANLSVGGHDVIVNNVFTTTSFSTPLGNTLSITGYNATNGTVSYTYTLNDNENHANGNGKNSLFEDFTVSLRDTDGDTATNTLSVNIVDDVPTANADDFSITKPPLPKYNLIFNLDVSGSMGDMILGTGKTRLQILKESLTSNGALLDSYAAASSGLLITFVTFASNAQTSQEFDNIQAAKSFINALSANGSTNYTAAMNQSQTLMNADKANPALAEYIDKTYFISDGQPNVGTPNSGNYLTWQNNINTNGVDSIVINIAPPASQQNVDQYLTPLANPGDTPAVYHVNANLSNLQDILISTIGDVAHISGNILVNDIAGADGNLHVTQIQFAFASSAAATAYLNAHSDLIGASVNGVNVIIPIPQNSDIATPNGEKLHLNADGTFTYTIDGNAQVGKTDSFTYTAVDNDGDPTTAQAQLHVIAPQSLQMTITSFSVETTSADSHNDVSAANSDVAFATSKAPFAGDLMANDVIGAQGAKVIQLSFETDDAAKYIKDNHLESLNAVADKDGKTVHIPLPEDGAEIEFTTPQGGSLAANNSGEYAYTVSPKATDQVEHFTYTLKDLATGNLHDAKLDVNVFEHPTSLVNLMGSDANDIMSTANHNANAIMMEGGKGINDFIIDVGDSHAPETIFIKDLGMSKQNVLSFVGVQDSNHDGKVDFMDAVASFHQEGPNANLEITLQNKSTVILENVGTVPGHDMQALQQHLESITADLHVTK